MSKLGQLQWIRRLGLPTPPFRELTYADFRAGRRPGRALRFPLAVRSTYSAEDGATRSLAGHFHTALGVEEENLAEAVAAVFAAYPRPEEQSVILQEMIRADFSGVLFAYRRACWRVEWIEGAGEALVSGHTEPNVLLLPRLAASDRWLALPAGRWPGGLHLDRGLRSALVDLAVFAGRLLADSRAEYGLDIEFSVRGKRLYLLQARPVTTPQAAEEVLTSANHKEILPPYPSRLMTSVIAGAGETLFGYYRELDPSLTPRRFILPAAGMPWINLTALLDAMVRWGLPTKLVCASVGAEDPYGVGLRPYVAVARLRVFGKVLGQQLTARRAVKRWVKRWREESPLRRKRRADAWASRPGAAFGEWLADFQRLYVELVTHMQALTGAMSGPVAVLSRLGILEKAAPYLRQKSVGADYLAAFRALRTGRLARESFLDAFGHRGFYESDIGQRRFREYTEAEWEQLTAPSPESGEIATEKGSRAAYLWGRLIEPVVRLIHAREWIRHESMRFFWDFRRELQSAAAARFGADFAPWAYEAADLEQLFAGEMTLAELSGKNYEPQSGWDINTFLADGYGRRIPLAALTGGAGRSAVSRPIGIYPGRVTGQVWRVGQAGLSEWRRPDFPVVILVADALDPGWIPFFDQVDAVASYVGGLLSHASIILREARIPAVTQLPADLELKTGDWVTLDGKTGAIAKTGRPEEQ